MTKKIIEQEHERENCSSVQTDPNDNKENTVSKYYAWNLLALFAVLFLRIGIGGITLLPIMILILKKAFRLQNQERI